MIKKPDEQYGLEEIELGAMRSCGVWLIRRLSREPLPRPLVPKEKAKLEWLAALIRASKTVNLRAKPGAI
jgi:hypothetical protein